jgi:hypothetical protein
MIGKGLVAQWLEQRTHNPLAAGSNPAGPTLLGVLLLGIMLSAVTLRSDSSAPPLRSIPNTAFHLGERLEYDISYAFISAGTAVFQVAKQPATVSRRPCYVVQFTVQSHKSLELIYKVRDTYTTWIDMEGIFPWQFTQRTRENTFKRDFKAVFDQVAKTATTTEGTFTVPPFVHDVVSAFYYVRTQPLKQARRGDVIRLQNFFDRETHDLRVKVLGRERITVEAGTFDCVVIEPEIASGSPFAFEGRLRMWMSADDRAIPVRVRTKIPIGSIDAELTSYAGTRGRVDAHLR